MPNATKVERVAELKEQIEGANALLLTEYRGLTVEEITELRRSLREVDASLSVIKNTLMLRAANDAGITELDELLAGPSAVAFVNGRRGRGREEAEGRFEAVPRARHQGWLHGRRGRSTPRAQARSRSSRAARSCCPRSPGC